MADSLISDGNAVDVTADRAVTKGDPVVFEGFHGIAMQDAASGDELALEVSLREHEISVPGSVTAAKGDVLYITDAGTVTNTSSGNRAFFKVTQAKDANNVVWGLLLPQA